MCLPEHEQRIEIHEDPLNFGAPSNSQYNTARLRDMAEILKCDLLNRNCLAIDQGNPNKSCRARSTISTQEWKFAHSTRSTQVYRNRPFHRDVERWIPAWAGRSFDLYCRFHLLADSAFHS